jgi:hypothetical protein
VKEAAGTGKTVLAIEVAKAVKAPLIEWHIKSTTKAAGPLRIRRGQPLRDSQLGDARVKDIANYIRKGSCGGLHLPEAPRAADRRDRQGRHRVPQRLLQELDRMEFYVYETGETIKAVHRPSC